jgi:MacB-like periplasmic core domain
VVSRSASPPTSPAARRPQLNGYTPAQSKAIFERAEAELAAIPGVRGAVGSSVPLLSDSNWGTNFRMEGLASGARQPNSKYNEAGPEFFRKAGIPLIAGREIRESDTAAAPKVAVVNETFVKQFFGGRNPIGHRLGFSKSGDLETEIVGVVKDRSLRTQSAPRKQPKSALVEPLAPRDKFGRLPKTEAGSTPEGCPAGGLC